MGRQAGRDLGRAIASVLRAGTLTALVAAAAGFALAVVGGSAGPGPQPLVTGIRGGGPDALIALGLLALTLTPPVALAVAAHGLWRNGERRHAVTGTVVVLLLLASLAVAAFIGPAI